MTRLEWTLKEWQAEAERLFGADGMSWRFVCPLCGHVAAVRDWHAAGAPVGAVAFSCVGRWMPECKKAFTERGAGPCDYAGGGLFRFNPILVTAVEEGVVHRVFDFDRSGEVRVPLEVPAVSDGLSPEATE